MRIDRKLGIVLVLCAVAVAVLVIYAWAGVSNAGPTGFSSNGKLVSGWYWLRSPSHTATWTFDASSIKGKKEVWLNFSPLITNGTNGGAGYCVDVLCSVDYGNGDVEPMTMQMFNPYRPQSPSNSGGIGYQCYGHSMCKLNMPPNCKGFKVKMMWPITTQSKYHMAVKKECLSLGRL